MRACAGVGKCAIRRGLPDVTGGGNRDDDRSLCTSMPTNRVGCSVARLLCLRLHARPSGATLDHAHGETGHPFRAATGSSGEGSSARCCTDTDQAGSKGCALGGSRAEPWSCFPSPGSSGPETDMRSWLSGRLEPVWHHHQITMGQQLRSPPGRRRENLGVRRARIFWTRARMPTRPGFAGIGTRVSAMSCFDVSSRQTSGHSGSCGRW